MNQIVPGTLLISDPFLKDPNFLRSVVMVCDHQFEGSLGFILNKKHDQTLGELINEVGELDIPVFYGGPVQINTLHFLHQRPELIEGGFPITDEIYWGGDFEQVISLLKDKLITQNDIRFYIGYSGWSKGQLEFELQEKSWITSIAKRSLIFHKYADMIWKDSLKDLGGEFATLVNYPLDPQSN